MLRAKFLAGVAVLTVLASVLGSLVGLGGHLAASAASVAVAGLVVVVVAAVVGAGVVGTDTATTYW